ncbi:PAQR family membrane homeostasis protein TrhA [Salirhabdus salicampi]|uniref:PAQR family membrane homeostasis protein TrhA n=1 Tax=Salirhabdus salicampi TaxID=476102 RepID=UPI0020C34C5D|nr:hemolysin III family protein [Salirhabdus salicampi]MCP8615474.1 hemolysin III family protein [Salirhabdus salicampi]
MNLTMREPINTLTHFITFIAGIVGLIVLIVLSRNEPSKLTVMCVYGVSLILLYGASSIYHWVTISPKKLLIFKKIDHISIYIFIAGSYTPVFYYGLESAWRWVMLLAVWILAIIGILLKVWFIHAPRKISTIFYIGLGWVAIIPFGQLIHNLPTTAIMLMIMGGLAYTVGGVIYSFKILDFFPNKFGFHEIFHLFVMAGSVAHFFMIYLFILPM